MACVGLGLKAKAFQAAIKGSGKGERCLGVGGNGERRQVESGLIFCGQLHLGLHNFQSALSGAATQLFHQEPQVENSALSCDSHPWALSQAS